MFSIQAYKIHRKNLLSPISHPFIALSSPFWKDEERLKNKSCNARLVVKP